MPLREVICLTLFGCGLAQGQFLMEGLGRGGPILLKPEDEIVFSGREPRRDLPCEVKLDNPVLEYDLAFHTGYRIGIPVRALGRGGNNVTTILQVAPEGNKDPVYFSQSWRIPLIVEGTGGEAAIPGKFVIGEGNYRVALLVRDDDEHVCATFWQISAQRQAKDRGVTLPIAPGAVEPATRDPFRQEDPVQRDSGEPLSILVLLHADPESVGAAQIGARETESMASILRGIDRDPRFARFSVTAFSLEQRAVLFRQKDAPEIEFPALGKALNELHPGTISVQKLVDSDGGPRFLADLLAEDLTDSHPDLVVIMGPRGAPNGTSLGKFVKQLPHPSCPVFYLSYSAAPGLNPWRDLLSSVVKSWNGMEFVISNPHEVLAAWAGVISRLSGKSIKPAHADGTDQ